MFCWFKKKTAAPAQPDRSMLVPRIKNLQFNTALRRMKIPEDQLPYTEPLVADLLVTYAFDLPSMFQMATRSGIADLGIPLEEARDVAVANLQQRLPRVHAEQQGPFQRIVTGENLEACTLLIRPYWDHVAKQVPGEVVVAIPSRDVVLCCSSQSHDGIGMLRAVSAEVLRQESNHGLTDRLLVWRNGKWEEFQD